MIKETLIVILCMLFVSSCNSSGGTHGFDPSQVSTTFTSCKNDTDCHFANIRCSPCCSIYNNGYNAVLNSNGVKANNLWLDKNCANKPEISCECPQFNPYLADYYLKCVEGACEAVAKLSCERYCSVISRKNNDFPPIEELMNLAGLSYEEIQECTCVVENGTAEIDGIELHLSKATINTSEIKKIAIDPMITNNPALCYSPNLNEPDCVCQKGYRKVVDASGAICLPEACAHISGHMFIGDQGEPNYRWCLSAIDSKTTDRCGYINYQQGIDLCYFAVVELTGNLSLCNRIKDVYLQNECTRDIDNVPITATQIGDTSLCNTLEGEVFIDDLGISNTEICRSALFKSNIKICEMVNYAKGQEVCKLAYDRYALQ